MKYLRWIWRVLKKPLARVAYGILDDAVDDKEKQVPERAPNEPNNGTEG